MYYCISSWVMLTFVILFTNMLFVGLFGVRRLSVMLFKVCLLMSFQLKLRKRDREKGWYAIFSKKCFWMLGTYAYRLLTTLWFYNILDVANLPLLTSCFVGVTGIFTCFLAISFIHPSPRVIDYDGVVKLNNQTSHLPFD